jgi:hypothetical protein
MQKMLCYYVAGGTGCFFNKEYYLRIPENKLKNIYVDVLSVINENILYWDDGKILK